MNDQEFSRKRIRSRDITNPDGDHSLQKCQRLSNNQEEYIIKLDSVRGLIPDIHMVWSTNLIEKGVILKFRYCQSKSSFPLDTQKIQCSII